MPIQMVFYILPHLFKMGVSVGYGGVGLCYSVIRALGRLVQAGSRVGFLPLSLSHHTKW